MVHDKVFIVFSIHFSRYFSFILLHLFYLLSVGVGKPFAGFVLNVGWCDLQMCLTTKRGYTFISIILLVNS